MFFPEKIKSIKHCDYVLEIGPGGTPHPRSNVFLEKTFKNGTIAQAQRGYTPELKTTKKIIYYDGITFPFKNNEFDYIICSHVLEHVPNIESFLAEMFRVAKKGYIEYPLVYYDYIYDFPEHLNFLKLHQGTLYHMPKSEISLSEFSDVTKLFYESLKAGHICLIDALKNEFFEGFEWESPFKIQKTEKISDVCWKDIKIIPPYNKKFGISAKAKKVLKRLLMFAD